MIQIQKHNVGKYIERFLDGQTSNEEEQALYAFFRSGNVPRRYRKYSAMFDWYSSGMAEPLPEKAATRPLWRWIAAASVVAVLGGTAWRWHEYREQQEWYDCYEGSYIIRNGQKMTDIRQIMPALEQCMGEGELLDWEFETDSQPDELVEI